MVLICTCTWQLCNHCYTDDAKPSNLSGDWVTVEDNPDQPALKSTELYN